MDKYIEKFPEFKDGSSVSDAYIAEPENHDDKERIPLLIAIHGNGREALSYKEVPFYARQRDIALECGFLFAAVSNGHDAFGYKKGYENVKKLYEYIKSKYNIYPEIALWASSAGGLLMHRFCRDYPDNVGLLLGTFPVCDPLGISNKESLYKALEVKAGQEKKLIDKIRPFLPFEHSFDIYKKIKIVISHGRDDVAVSIAQSRLLLEKVKKAGGDMVLFEAEGGHSTSNFSIYDTPEFHKALKEMHEKVRSFEG